MAGMQAPRLALFFTRGTSLRFWQHYAILARELALYRRLQERGVSVTFVTYGDASDLAFARMLPGIRILCNRWGLPSQRYERWLPLLHGWYLWQTDVYKSNQTDGADVALRAARLWRKPMIARCGYVWSEFMARQQGDDSAAAHHARTLEQTVFTAAQRVVVTTAAMQQSVTQRFPDAAPRTTVIPNYVDTEHFQPNGAGSQDGQLIFVGRLSAQKNMASLLAAIEPLDVNLTVIGSGDLREDLQRRFAGLDGRVRWRGYVPHPQVPTLLNQASLFVLPSHYEGHPKALLEAMACGLPVIGADVPGIRDVIRHGENGWLCGPDPASLRAAIQELLARPQLRAELGRNARQHVLDHFALDRIVEMDLAVLREAAAR